MNFLPNLSKIRPPFPEVFDNTMRSAFRACPAKFNYEFLQCLRPDTFQEHLHAGAAFAEGTAAYRIEFFGHSRNHDTAVLVGYRAFIKAYGFDPAIEQYLANTDSVKDFTSMSCALLDYFEEYRGDTDIIHPHMMHGNVPCVEKSFTLPLDIAHPETGQPILYTGRFDFLGEHSQYSGGVYVVDDKTTKQLGASWHKQWDLRSQFTGYCWGAKTWGFNIAGVIIRGVGIYKNSIGHQQVISHRSQYDIDRWCWQRDRDIKAAIKCWQEGAFDYDLAEACSAYGGCSFKKLCTTPRPEIFLPQYKRVRWLPHEQRIAHLDDSFKEIIQ